MAVELIKPGPADEPDDTDTTTSSAPLADVIELVPDHGGADEGAAETPRLRALLDLVVGEFQQALDERHENPEPRQGRRPRAVSLSLPVVWSLRHYAFQFEVAGFRTLGVGSRIMWRRGRAGYAWARGARPAVKAPAAAASGKPEQVKGKPPAKGKATAKKKAAAKGKGKGKGKAAATPAPEAGGRLSSAVVFLTFGGMITIAVATLIADHIKIISSVVVALIILWIPVAWVVGGVALAGKPQEDAGDQGAVDGTAPAVAQDDVDATGEQGQDDETADAAQGSGETDDQAVVGGGEVAADPHAEAEAARRRTYAWVRAEIAAGNGRAVHLRTLWWKASQQPGREGLKMADVRAGLEGHGVVIQPQVKAPVWGDPKVPDGTEKNRPGVHVKDLPQGYTPIETPGSTLVRLLPDLPASDLQ